MGDFTGESLHVGPPTYRVQEQMTTPVVFLNLPPMHRDIISGTGEITINNGAYAQHIGDQTTGEVYSTESKREWELSTGFEMGVGGGGAKVKQIPVVDHGLAVEYFNLWPQFVDTLDAHGIGNHKLIGRIG